MNSALSWPSHPAAVALSPPDLIRTFMNSLRMRHNASFLVGALLLAVTACGGGEGEEAAADEEKVVLDLAEFTRDGVPDSVDRLRPEDLPDKPTSAEPMNVRMAWNAMEMAHKAGNHVDPDATAECPGPELEPEVGATLTCDVVYMGEEFTWDMEVTSGGVLIQYEQTLSPVPVTRERVEHLVRWQVRGEYVRCDMPEMVTAEHGEDAGVTCESWNDYAHSTHRVTVSQDGMHGIETPESDYGAEAA